MKNWLGMNAAQLIGAVRLASRMTFAPHDGAKTGWKLNATGDAIELKDGNPVWVNADGSETTMGGDTIARLNSEAARNRTRYETAEASLEAFKGLDATKAREALEKLGKIDQGKLIDSGKVDEVRSQVGQEFQTKIDELTKQLNEANGRADNYLLDNAFGASKFIGDKLTIPTDMVQAVFGKNFKVEDGKVVAYDSHGNKMLSRNRAGELANLDEALDQLVQSYSGKDHIMKGDNQHGGGAGGGEGGRGGKKTYRRAEIDQLNNAGRASDVAQIMESVTKGEAQLID